MKPYIKYLKLLFILLACFFLLSSIGYLKSYNFLYKNQKLVKLYLPPSPEILALRDRIDRILEQYEDFEYETSLKITSLKYSQIFYERDHLSPKIPASNLKLITTAAAYDLLGSNFSWKTTFYLDKEQNIHIKASGDPYFSINDLDETFSSLADSLKKYNLNKINGNIIIDSGTFNDFSMGYGWKPENRIQPYSAKPSPLAFYENLIKLEIIPTASGRPPAISIYPTPIGIELENSARTTANRTRDSIYLIVDSLSNKITINGNIWVRSRPQTRYMAVQDPQSYALEIFRQKLIENNIEIAGDIYYNQFSEFDFFFDRYDKLFTLQSGNLNEVVANINKNSNNFMANQLFLTIGDEIESTTETINLIKKWLKSNKIDTEALIMHDGSGLSMHNRASTEILTDVLKLMYHSKHAKQYVNSMAISGVDGTLKTAFEDPILHEKIYAKTGFIIGARSLSGYIKTADDEVLAFSLIINKENSRIRNFNEIAERILIELALFSRSSIKA